jgi:hypothetical protein
MAEARPIPAFPAFGTAASNGFPQVIQTKDSTGFEQPQVLQCISILLLQPNRSISSQESSDRVRVP